SFEGVLRPVRFEISRAQRAIGVGPVCFLRDGLLVGGSRFLVTAEVEISLAEIQLGFRIVGAQVKGLLVRCGSLVVLPGVEIFVTFLVVVLRVERGLVGAPGIGVAIPAPPAVVGAVTGGRLSGRMR